MMTEKIPYMSKIQLLGSKLQKKLISEAEKFKIEEEDIIVKVGECMQVQSILLEFCNEVLTTRLTIDHFTL